MCLNAVFKVNFLRRQCSLNVRHSISGQDVNTPGTARVRHLKRIQQCLVMRGRRAWHHEGASCHGDKPLSGTWPSRAHTPCEGKGRRHARWSGVLRRDHRVVPHELCGTRRRARRCPKPPERGIKFMVFWVFWTWLYSFVFHSLVHSNRHWSSLKARHYAGWVRLQGGSSGSRSQGACSLWMSKT